MSDALPHSGPVDNDDPDGPRVAPVHGGRARQLVVLCHGHGGNGSQQLLRARRMARFLPRAGMFCPHAPRMIKQDPTKRRWFSTNSPTVPIPVEEIDYGIAALNAQIDAELDRLGGPPDGFALLGFSQGASVALSAGLRRADNPPCAVVSFAGLLPWPRNARPPIAARPAILLAHGEADPVVPILRARENAAALREEGVPIETLWLPDVGHTIETTGLFAGIAFLKRHFGRA